MPPESRAPASVPAALPVAEEPPAGAPARPLAQRLTTTAGRAFPGDRRVWVTASILGLLLLLYSGYKLTQPFERLTGTNSVNAYAVVANAPKGSTVCLGRLDVPAGTARLQVFAGFPQATAPRVNAELRFGGGRVERIGPLTLQQPGTFQEIPIRQRPASPDATPAELCMTPLDSSMDLGGATVQLLPGERPLTVDGTPVADRDAAVRFMPPAGEKASTISRAAAAFERAALFRPSPLGPWTYWLIAFVLFPVFAYLAIRVLATAPERSPRALALPIGLIAFGLGASFAVSTPIFQGPDESEHFAYAQYLAETGHVPDRTQTTRPPYSTEQARLLQGLHHNSTLGPGATRPRWLEADEDRWKASTRRDVPDGDGGGYTISATGHSPLYYGALAPAYGLGSLGDMTAEVTLMRLFNAALAALIAACAALTVLEIAPSRKGLAATAGLVAAFQPMLAFVAGTINNDTAVNVAAALCLYGAVRALRRGLSVRLAVALGAGIAMLPLAKVTGFGVVPAVVLALAIAAWRSRRARATWVALGAGVATFAGVALVWTQAIGRLLAPDVGATLVTTGTSDPTQLAAARDPLLLVDYLIQYFLPFVHLTGDHHPQDWPFYDIFVERGWGSFGWVAIEPPPKVFQAVCAVMIAVALLAIVAAVRHRAALRERWPAAVVLVVGLLGVIGLVAAAYATDVNTRLVPGEQGRYAFPAVVPLAGIVALGCAALGRRLQPVLCAALVALTIGAGLGGWGVMMSGFYV